MDRHRAALERIAAEPDRLLTPFSWQAVAEKMQDIAAHALGWREGHDPLPELKHANRREVP